MSRTELRWIGIPSQAASYGIVVNQKEGDLPILGLSGLLNQGGVIDLVIVFTSENGERMPKKLT